MHASASDTGDYPRVLVVSNNCFSSTGSNGQTLAALFVGRPTSRIAQFYIKDEVPDSPVCRNYFRVTDVQAVRAILARRRPAGGRVEVASAIDSANSMADTRSGPRKTPFTALARNLAWRSGAWARNGFVSWVEAFGPEVVVLQAGDSAFMYSIATQTARKMRIPLVIYNSEDYYFKTRDFMSKRKGWVSTVLYAAFLRGLRKQTEKAIEYASCSIYNSDMLRQTYEERFRAPATTVMTATSVTPRAKAEANALPVVSYVGNLGLGRHESLIAIGCALQRLDPRLHLDVYGRAPSAGILEQLQAAPGIRYRGFVSYEQVLDVMAASDLLVHAESFLPFYREDLKHAMSTKIADSLASGTCLMVYAPASMACSRYLAEQEAALVVSEESALDEALAHVLRSEGARAGYVVRALQAVARNHSYEASVAKFQRILHEVTCNS